MKKKKTIQLEKNSKTFKTRNTFSYVLAWHFHNSFPSFAFGFSETSYPFIISDDDASQALLYCPKPIYKTEFFMLFSTFFPKIPSLTPSIPDNVPDHPTPSNFRK